MSEVKNEMATPEKLSSIEILLNAEQKLQVERNWEKGLITVIESVSRLQFDGCGVFLVDHARKTLHSHLGKGVFPPEKRISVYLKNTECPGVRCVLEKKTLHKRNNNVGEKWGTSEPHFRVWVPVIVQDEAFGALAVEKVKWKCAITEDDVRNLEALACMCADFIERTKISFNPVPEKMLNTKLRYRLDSPDIYIIVEKNPEKSFDIFCDRVTHGIPGFVVSRMHPQKLKRRYNLRKTPVMWLSRTETEITVNPDDFSKLNYTISEFTARSGESVILLDGIEYLITQISFDAVRAYLKELRDVLVINNSRLLIPLHKGTLSPGEYSILKEEFVTIESN